MRQKPRLFRLILILMSIAALFSILPASLSASSAASDWQRAEGVGNFRYLRADPRSVDSFIAAPQQPAQVRAQAAQIIVEYDGFSPEAQAAFQAAVDIWQGLINAPIPIRVKATWTPLEQGVLGGAGATGFLVNPSNNIAYPLALAQQIIGQDLYPGEADIKAVFNSSNSSWFFGTGQAPANQYSLVTVVLHELGHGLGFGDTYAVQGGQGGYGVGPNKIPVIFDTFVANNEGTALVGGYGNPSAALAAQLQGGALIFNGAATKAANGGTAPKLYAPNPYEDGSSVAHWDENTYGPGNPQSLMTPQLRRGETILNPGSFTLAAFTDMGWSVNAAPAPSPSPSPTPAPSASPTPAPSASPTPAPSASPTPAPSASPTPAPSASPTPRPSPPPSPPPTGNGGYLPGLPNTGDGGMGGGGNAGSGWLLVLPFIALAAGLPLFRRVRRNSNG